MLLGTRCTNTSWSPCLQFFWIYTQKWNCWIPRSFSDPVFDRTESLGCWGGGQGRAKEGGGSRREGAWPAVTGHLASLTSGPPGGAGGGGAGRGSPASRMIQTPSLHPLIHLLPGSGRQVDKAFGPLWTDKDEAQGGRISQPAAWNQGPALGPTWGVNHGSARPPPVLLPSGRPEQPESSHPKRCLCQEANQPETQPRASGVWRSRGAGP